MATSCLSHENFDVLLGIEFRRSIVCISSILVSYNTYIQNESVKHDNQTVSTETCQLCVYTYEYYTVYISLFHIQII